MKVNLNDGQTELRPIDKILEDIKVTSAELKTARIEGQALTERISDLVNRLNGLQKQFDVAAEDVRKRAIEGTDWSLALARQLSEATA